MQLFGFLSLGLVHLLFIASTSHAFPALQSQDDFYLKYLQKRTTIPMEWNEGANHFELVYYELKADEEDIRVTVDPNTRMIHVRIDNNNSPTARRLPFTQAPFPRGYLAVPNQLAFARVSAITHPGEGKVVYRWDKDPAYVAAGIEVYPPRNWPS